MTSPTRSLWPERVRRPLLRLAVALVVAPLALAAMLTGLAFLAAGSTMATRESTMALTAEAATAFFVFLPGLTLTTGLAGVAALWRFALRGVLAWIAAGVVTGALAPVGLALATGGALVPMQAVIAAALGVAIFLLIRWVAGVRIS